MSTSDARNNIKIGPWLKRCNLQNAPYIHAFVERQETIRDCIERCKQLLEYQEKLFTSHYQNGLCDIRDGSEQLGVVYGRSPGSDDCFLEMQLNDLLYDDLQYEQIVREISSDFTRAVKAYELKERKGASNLEHIQTRIKQYRVDPLDNKPTPQEWNYRQHYFRYPKTYTDNKTAVEEKIKNQKPPSPTDLPKTGKAHASVYQFSRETSPIGIRRADEPDVLTPPHRPPSPQPLLGFPRIQTLDDLVDVLQGSEQQEGPSRLERTEQAEEQLPQKRDAPSLEDKPKRKFRLKPPKK